MQAHIKTPAFKTLVDKLYATYNNGFYVYAPPIKQFNVGAVNYIVRYTGRPVLAQSRIKAYDGKFVTFTYTPHGCDTPVTETISVFDFIKRLIIHIPDREFKMIRYYGFYAVRNRKHALYLRRQRLIESFSAFQRKQTASWRKRIIISFGYDPLKCTCGAYFELMEIFYPTPYKPKRFTLF